MAKIRVVVVISGGVLQEVACDRPDEIEVVLADWDVTDPGSDTWVEKYPVDEDPDFLEKVWKRTHPAVAQTVEHGTENAG